MGIEYSEVLSIYTYSSYGYFISNRYQTALLICVIYCYYFIISNILDSLRKNASTICTGLKKKLNVISVV